MNLVKFPYGTGIVEYHIPEERLQVILVSKMHHYKAEYNQEELVRRALETPLGTQKLNALTKGKKNIVLIVSDHTRPIPSKVIVPQMLEELRKRNPNADITILISTGCHRTITQEEIENKFDTKIIFFCHLKYFL